VLDLAVQMNIVSKSGTWYSFKDERLGQGRDRAIDLLTEQHEMLARIEQEVKQELGFFPAIDLAQETNGSGPEKPAATAAKSKKASAK
jgi:recombination protein RecA